MRLCDSGVLLAVSAAMLVGIFADQAFAQPSSEQETSADYRDEDYGMSPDLGTVSGGPTEVAPPQQQPEQQQQQAPEHNTRRTTSAYSENPPDYADEDSCKSGSKEQCRRRRNANQGVPRSDNSQEGTKIKKRPQSHDFSSVDKDGDGEISQEEFSEMQSRTIPRDW